MSAFCYYNFFWGGNTLKVIFIMTGCILYGSLVLLLLYGFGSKKYQKLLRWVAFSLALLPIIVLVAIFYMLGDADVDNGRLLMR